MCAKHNAMIYGVADRIEFILGDYLELIPRLKVNAIKEFSQLIKTC
ncbi:17794_t:CDS:2 [Racocetra fulgida]|uniref:Trimethylguanosine synthase n=1 Tax=Racocetra fulgida TaxID=60492 RepID=A0A9N8ZNT6_9GLOM|nr:17794_t:CDS:2 [Racocetra fulgida]